MIVGGVDPGKSGAIVFIDGEAGVPRAVQVWAMPTLLIPVGGKPRPTVDAYGIVRVLRSTPITHIFVEKVGAQPGDGAVGAFTFGRGFGDIEGAVAALEIPVTYVTPQKWKSTMGVTSNKDTARARASQLLPMAANMWPKVSDDGKAEAALIALYGLRKLSNVERAVSPVMEAMARSLGEV